MNISEFISAFIPEWNTEFNYKAKSIKRLYPNLIRQHKLGNEWLNEEDIAMLESCLEDIDFQAYTLDWKRNFNSYHEENKKVLQSHYDSINKMVASLREKQKIPGTKKCFDVPDKPFSIFDPAPGLYTDFLTFNFEAQGLSLVCEPQALLVNDDSIDILCFNLRKNSGFGIQKFKRFEFMKFPIDHMIHGYPTKMALHSTLCAMALNTFAPWLKIGKILDISPNIVVELPFKQWEVDQMLKYYHVMKDTDYSKRFAR